MLHVGYAVCIPASERLDSWPGASYILENVVRRTWACGRLVTIVPALIVSRCWNLTYDAPKLSSIVTNVSACWYTGEVRSAGVDGWTSRHGCNATCVIPGRNTHTSGSISQAVHEKPITRTRDEWIFLEPCTALLSVGSVQRQSDARGGADGLIDGRTPRRMSIYHVTRGQALTVRRTRIRHGVTV